MINMAGQGEWFQGAKPVNHLGPHPGEFPTLVEAIDQMGSLAGEFQYFSNNNSH